MDEDEKQRKAPSTARDICSFLTKHSAHTTSIPNQVPTLNLTKLYSTQKPTTWAAAQALKKIHETAGSLLGILVSWSDELGALLSLPRILYPYASRR